MEICGDIGSNHCGSLELALEHIRILAQCEATMAKMQLFRAETYYAAPERQEKVRKYEVPLEWLPVLSKCAHKRGLKFGMSVFAPNLVESLQGHVDFVKIASLDIGYLSLIRKASKLNVPIIISTGASTLDEVHRALSVVECFGVTLLHCVCTYPTPLEAANLRVITTLQQAFPDIAIGYSDHTMGDEVAMIAVALGATLIEKHFRLAWYPGGITGQISLSPDYGHSVPPADFKLMVQKIRMVEQALGPGKKDGPLPIEEGLVWAKRSDAKTLRR